MSKPSKSSPGSPPDGVPSPTPSRTPPATSSQGKFNEEKLRGLFSTLSKEEILSSWNLGVALAGIDLAMQDRLIDPPLPPKKGAAKKT
jgi:hypothetical protein